MSGVAIGDALGVPVEFQSRKYLKENPVIDSNYFQLKLDNEIMYNKLNEELIQKAEEIYSLNRLETNIENYYLGNIDFK